MKIIFVLDNYLKYYSIDDVVRELYRRGHEIVLILGQDKESPIPDDSLKKALSELSNLRMEPLIKRRILRKVASTIRELINYSHILKREEERRWDVKNWGRFFHPFVWQFLSRPVGKKVLKWSFTSQALRFIQQKIPVAPEIKRHIQQHAPDILIALPLISGDSREGEYIQAANALNIPTVYSMFSWDNIASKATFHSKPGSHLVWNKPLADELSLLHDIPRERIYVTGAARFSRLLEHKDEYLLPRDEFCRVAGIDPSKKYILYVGSTYLLDSKVQKTLNEDLLIVDIARELAKNEKTQDVHVLVRPHPVNARIIPALHAARNETISIYPSPGELPDTEEKRRMFYNSIYHSVAVVGVNTTAFLEASALDKPCVTIISKEYGETQQLVHFHHLVDGGFLETANRVEDMGEIIGQIVSGTDERAVQRREFVKNFLKSLESGKSAVTVYADLMERLGVINNPLI